VFIPTKETLRQVQDRVLPLNSTINGVLVASDAVRIPLYTANPAWATLSVVGGYPVTDSVNLTFGLNNIFDQNYRSMGSGIDAPGINAFASLHYSF
jgi:outer membrane receptor protein involved in Fe transport